MVPQSKTNESKPSKTTPGTGTATATTKKTNKKRDSDPIDDEAGADCKFPTSRVRRLVRAEDPTIRATPDSIFLINKASDTVRKGIELLRRCDEMVSKLGLFSSNETKDDVNTSNLKYLLEMFIEKLAEDAFNNMIKERKKSLQYKHLSSTVQHKKRYEFISDFVPEKVRAEDALQERASLSDSRP